MNKTTRNFRAKCTTGGGFTLAELLIVVAVIAVLVAVAIPTFAGQLEKSRQGVDMSTLRDAYAVAQMDVLNQDDAGDLKNAKADLTEDTYAYFWYNPSTNKLLWAKESQMSAKVLPAGYVCGKAQTATAIIDATQLPNHVTYTQLTKDDTNGYKAGTTDKAVLVVFKYTATDNAWTIDSIDFAGNVTAETSTVYSTGKTVLLKTTADTDPIEIEVTSGSTVSVDLKTYLNLSFEGAYASKPVASPTFSGTITIQQNNTEISSTNAGITFTAGTATLSGSNVKIGVYEITGITVSATPAAFAGETPSAHTSAPLKIILTVK